MNSKSHILLLFTFLLGLHSYAQNIQFIENKGQWDSRVLFKADVSNGALFINQDGYTVVQHHPEDWKKYQEAAHHRSASLKDISVRGHAYKVQFENANLKAYTEADKPLFTYNNYFIGNDPSKWASNCRIFQGITIKDIYPNIDLRYYSNNGTLKYDLIVRPGGKVSDIVLKYDGIERLSLRKQELTLSTSIGELTESAPFTYQYNERGRVVVNAKYSLKDKNVRFDIKDYDPSTTLIIDPTLEFCSFSGSTSENWGYTATYGPDGSMFGGGISGGAGFPVSNGAFQTTYAGGQWDISIIKLTPDGTNRVYATYIGGADEEQPHSLISDPQGNLIIAGRTRSTSGPASGRYPTTGVGQIGIGGGYDLVITKLNASGTALIGSKTIGGSLDDGTNIRDEHDGGAESLVRNYGDDGRSEVNIDAAGNIYLAACTQSTNFPVPNGFQTSNGGGLDGQDAVILKMAPDVSSLLFSSYLGGNGNDAAYVVSIHPSGEIFVAGGTESTNFPGPMGGSITSSNQGQIDGFVSIIANNGSSIIRSTYLGTAGFDQIYGIQFDRFGFPYVMGTTTGTWPVVNAPWSQNNGKQFIAKLQPNLSNYVYSTVFGKGQANPDISPTAFLVDRCENVYVSGWGGNSSFPNAGVQGLTVTPDAIKSSPDIGSSGLGEDFYFFVLEKNATGQLYGSFFGQNNGAFWDHVDGGTSRFDEDGVIYQAICASCASTAPFPTFPNPGVWAPVKPASANCNLAMLKISFNLAGVRGGIQSIIDGRPRDTSGCVPLTVEFVDTVATAESYEWNFGDGSPQVTTTEPSVSHTFTAIGTYQVMMVAIDPTTCNVRDTSYININVGDLRAALDFNPVKLNPCDSFKYRFDNVSIAPPARPFGPQAFKWNFGDGSATVTTGPGAVFHNYTTPGTYNVMLILNDSTYCNYPDTLIRQIRVATTVIADFDLPPVACAPFNAQFENTSQGGQEFIWNFGDGTGSTEVSPSHLYTNPGTYNVTLIAVDSATCNIADTTVFTLTVSGAPTADFSAAPQPPQINVPISFTNLSSPDAVNFKWLFGDGDSLITTSRNNIQHEYNATGTFNACLIAYNAAGCPDTICRPVVTLIESSVDVPNAFTPGRGGVNSVVHVRGYGIAKMTFTVYARWGEKIFESNNKNQGWNGYYKGALLPMDVYAYTLEVEFSDGTKTSKTGDITLIR